MTKKYTNIETCSYCGADVKFYHGSGITRIVCAKNCQGYKVIEEVNHKLMRIKMKFEIGDIIRHVKSGTDYTIVGTPDKIRLEKENIPAYAYREIDKPNSIIWLRCENEVEDGRFIEMDNE